MTVFPVRRAVLALLLLATGVAANAAAQTTLSRDEQTQFLLTAKVTSGTNIPRGINHPIRLTLTDGTVTHTAAFSDVDEHIAVMKYTSGRTELDFVDSYKYSVAAFRLAVLLGIDNMMPVTVEREIKHQKGSLSWWVDDVKWDEGDRMKQKLEAPDPEAWAKQMFRMRLFTQLVADTDRNTGNVLITSDWTLWMIDFTRAFRRTHQLLAPGDVTRCDRQLLEKVRALTKDQVAAATKPFIGGAEVDALMARRDLLLALIDKLVAEKGEAQVLY